MSTSTMIYTGALASILIGTAVSFWQDIEALFWLMVGCFAVWCLIAMGHYIYSDITAGNTNHTRLIAQCMADGKKEYECVALLQRPQSNTQVIPIPLILPVR